jgi:hypothetical protein
MKKYKLIKKEVVLGAYGTERLVTYVPDFFSVHKDLLNFYCACAFSQDSIDDFVKIFNYNNILTNEILSHLSDNHPRISHVTGDILFSSDGEYYAAYISKDRKTVYALNDDYPEEKVVIDIYEYYQLIQDLKEARKTLNK